MSNIWEAVWIQYGALGLLILVLVWIMMRRESDLKDNHDKTTGLLESCQEEKQLCLEHLIEQRKEMLDVIKQHREEMKELNKKLVEVVQNNTEVAAHVTEIIRKCQSQNDSL